MRIDQLRAAQDRDLSREGIPMFLALVDETGAPPVTGDTTDGQRVAALVDAARAALTPGAHDADLGVLGAVVGAVAHADFGRTG